MSNDERSAANHIHHLALAHEWHAALSGDRRYRRSSIDRTLDEEGFVHCSFPDQVQRTADKYYRDRSDVVLLTIEPALIDDEIRHENTSGGTELFPHVYGPIPVDAVVAARPVALLDDGTLDIGDALG
jgi:glutathione S-transferase